jgi:hypothetical protein
MEIKLCSATSRSLPIPHPDFHLDNHDIGSGRRTDHGFRKTELSREKRQRPQTQLCQAKSVRRGFPALPHSPIGKYQ